MFIWEFQINPWFASWYRILLLSNLCLQITPSSPITATAVGPVCLFTGLDNKRPQGKCGLGNFKCLAIPQPWPWPPCLPWLPNTTPSLQHPTASQHPHGQPPGLPSISPPVFPIAWVFPAKLSAKDFDFLKCTYLLKVGFLSRGAKGNNPEMHWIITVMNQYENKS